MKGRRVYWWEDELGLFRAWWSARTARLRTLVAENFSTSGEIFVNEDNLGDI